MDFANRDLRVITAQLRGISPELVTAAQMTCDLRRLRTHGLIEKIAHTHRYNVTEKIAHTHRYNVTDYGLHTAMFLTRIHERLLPTGLAHLAERSTPHRLRTAATAYRRAIDDLSNETGLAA